MSCTDASGRRGRRARWHSEARGPRATRGARAKPVFARRRPRRRIPTPDSNRDAIRGDPPRRTRHAVRRLLRGTRHAVRRSSDASRLRRPDAVNVTRRKVGPPRIGRRETDVFVRQVLPRPTAREAGSASAMRTRTPPSCLVETTRERVRHRHLHPSARASSRRATSHASSPHEHVANGILCARRFKSSAATFSTSARLAAPRPNPGVAYGRVPGPGDRWVVGVVVERVGFFFGSFACGVEPRADVHVRVDTARARGSFASFDVAANDGKTETDVDRPGLVPVSVSIVSVPVSVSIVSVSATLEVQRTRLRGEVLRLPEESPVERVELETRRRPRRAKTRALARAGIVGEDRGRRRGRVRGGEGEPGRAHARARGASRRAGHRHSAAARSAWTTPRSSNSSRGVSPGGVSRAGRPRPNAGVDVGASRKCSQTPTAEGRDGGGPARRSSGGARTTRAPPRSGRRALARRLHPRGPRGGRRGRLALAAAHAGKERTSWRPIRAARTTASGGPSPAETKRRLGRREGARGVARSGGRRADARREAVARAVERCSRPSLWSPRRVADLGSWLEDKTRGEGRANVGPSEESPSRAARTSRVSRRHQWRNRPSHRGSSRLFSRQVRTDKNRRFTTRRIRLASAGATSRFKFAIVRLEEVLATRDRARTRSPCRRSRASPPLSWRSAPRPWARGHARVPLRWWFPRSEPPSFQPRDPRGQDAVVPRAAWRGRRRRGRRGGRRRLGRGVPLVLRAAARGYVVDADGRAVYVGDPGYGAGASCSPARRPPRSPSPSRARSPRATAPLPRRHPRRVQRLEHRPGRGGGVPQAPSHPASRLANLRAKTGSARPPAPGRASTPSRANFACSWRNPPQSPLDSSFDISAISSTETSPFATPAREALSALRHTAKAAARRARRSANAPSRRRGARAKRGGARGRVRERREHPQGKTLHLPPVDEADEAAGRD